MIYIFKTIYVCYLEKFRLTLRKIYLQKIVDEYPAEAYVRPSESEFVKRKT